MTQENTESPFYMVQKDICGRLLYGVIVKLPHPYEEFKASVKAINPERGIIYYEKYGVKGSPLFETSIWGVKPYLRPMSSMTEKESAIKYKLFGNYILDNCPAYIDWLNEHHFDYRIDPSTGKTLIESDLAIEAPEGMYKTK